MILKTSLLRLKPKLLVEPMYRHYYCTFFGKVWEATFAIGKYTCMQGWLTHLLFPETLPTQQHKNLSKQEE